VFGGIIQESSYEDFWLLIGISSTLAENYMTQKCGFLNTKYKKYLKMNWLID